MAPISKFRGKARGDIGNSFVDVYTVPSGVDSVLTALHVSNVSTSGVQIDVEIVDTSEGETFTMKDLPVPVGSAIAIIEDARITLEENDILRVRCASSGELVDVHVSYIEDVNN